MFSYPKGAYFGVARKYAPDIANFIKMLPEQGIDAYEIGFAFGIPESLDSGVVKAIEGSNIKVSIHLPLWINLGNPKNSEKDMKRLLQGLKIADNLGTIAVFHLGFYGGKPFDKIFRNLVSVLKEVLTEYQGEGVLGLETTGKQSAIGTVEEILKIIEAIDDARVTIVIDWAHLYARSNGTFPVNIEDFERVLRDCEKSLGYKPYHFHAGGVRFHNGNEVKHLPARSLSPPLPNLLKALKNRAYESFTWIVESPTSPEDVLWLKRLWNQETRRKNYEDIF